MDDANRLCRSWCTVVLHVRCALLRSLSLRESWDVGSGNTVGSDATWETGMVGIKVLGSM